MVCVGAGVGVGAGEFSGGAARAAIGTSAIRPPQAALFCMDSRTINFLKPSLALSTIGLAELPLLP
jgi:hypothetical protein